MWTRVGPGAKRRSKDLVRGAAGGEEEEEEEGEWALFNWLVGWFQGQQPLEWNRTRCTRMDDTHPLRDPFTPPPPHCQFAHASHWHHRPHVPTARRLSLSE